MIGSEPPEGSAVKNDACERDSAHREPAAPSRRYADDSVPFLSQVLALLAWDLQCVTPLDFVQFFVAQGILYSSDFLCLSVPREKAAQTLNKYAEFLADLCLHEYFFQQVASLSLAAAIIAAARYLLHYPHVWTSELQSLTGVPYADITPHVGEILRFSRPLTS